jgi:hypothetical protein
MLRELPVRLYKKVHEGLFQMPTCLMLKEILHRRSPQLECRQDRPWQCQIRSVAGAASA